MYPNRFRAKPTLDATSPQPGAVSGGYQSAAMASLQALRERILQNMLNGSLVFSVIALIATIPPRLQKQQFGLIGIFLAAFAVLVYVTASKRMSYTLRAVFFLSLIALLGLSTLFSDGLYGNGRLFLMTLPIVSAILLGQRPGFVGLGINLGAIALAGTLMLTGVVTPPVFGTGNVNQSLAFWLLATAVASLVSSVTVISLVVMFRGFENTINSEQRLRSELNAERSSLETRIKDRTRDLERRLVQIRTAGEISLALNNELDPEKVLQQVVDLVQNRFDLYYVGVFLLDDRNENALLRAGSGEAGQKMLALGHHLPLNGNSMVAWAVQNRKARIALDVGKEAVRFNNPHLPNTRSEMALPIVVQGTAAGSGSLAMGALTVQSSLSAAFDQDDITILLNIASSLATALQNATLFKQLGRSLDEIRVLNRQYLQQAWSSETEQPIAAVSEDALLLSRSSNQPAQEISLPLALREQVIGKLEVLLPADAQSGAANLSTEDQAFLEAIINQTTLALENVRLVEETQRKASYDRLLTSITRTARSATDLDGILRSTLEELGSALRASEAVIQLKVASEEGESG